jgi:hypothetical protein
VLSLHNFIHQYQRKLGWSARFYPHGYFRILWNEGKAIFDEGMTSMKLSLYSIKYSGYCSKVAILAPLQTRINASVWKLPEWLFISAVNYSVNRVPGPRSYNRYDFKHDLF